MISATRIGETTSASSENKVHTDIHYFLEMEKKGKKLEQTHGYIMAVINGRKVKSSSHDVKFFFHIFLPQAPPLGGLTSESN